MVLPDPIQRYFDADNAGDGRQLAEAFGANGVVLDEGGSYHGAEAIADWWRATKAKYQHSAQPIEADDEGGEIIVRARVTGQFAGSPATLTYRFRLAGDRIASLGIGA